MTLYIPLVNPDFWAKLGPDLQAVLTRLWAGNIAGYRANTARAQENGKAQLQKQGVSFVDLPQAELDATRAKMLKEQDKAAEDARISPKLVQLVMADVGA